MKAIMIWGVILVGVFLGGCGGDTMSTNTAVNTNAKPTPISTIANTSANGNTKATPIPTVKPSTEKIDKGQFAFPPPKATLSAEIQLVDNEGKTNLTDFFNKIEESLNSAKYSGRYTFFSQNGEYALVTQAEQIEANGAPAKNRWTEESPTAQNAGEYFDYLFNGKMSNYRVMAFIVMKSENRFNPRRGAATSFEIAKSWMTSPEGEDSLSFNSDGSSNIVETDKHKAFVLIYLFEKTSYQDSPVFVENSNSTVDEQFEMTNIRFIKEGKWLKF